MIILGIDPGTKVTGYGLIEKSKDRILYIQSGYISTNNFLSIEKKMYFIFNKLQQIVSIYNPSYISLEDIFIYKNAKTALKLGQIRGALIVASMMSKNFLKIFSYSPREVKKSLVGYGNATKEQINFMVKKILFLEKNIEENEADGLALAICNSFEKNFK